MNGEISFVLPAKNEAGNLVELLPRLRGAYPNIEIIVVNDGSDDDTSLCCQKFGVTELKHPYSKGNGASIKSGARLAKGDAIVFMDGDGQHKPSDINKLIEEFKCGFDMVVGARSKKSQASFGRWCANTIYNKLAGWMTGRRIPDLTSGFRIVDREKFIQFLYMLPNGFSYPTTITMAFHRAGHSVSYVDIETNKRGGKSHINIVQDGTRFFLIIFKVGTLFSPLKIFFPVSLMTFSLGLIYYAYTYLTDGRFTNMGALLFSTSVIIFLMGLVSEQITTLMYSRINENG